MPGRKKFHRNKNRKIEHATTFFFVGGIESIKLSLQLLVEEFPVLVGAEKFRADLGRHLSSNHL
jgi:hypothetical protein